MLTGELVSIFCKKKLAMRAGETDKVISIKDKIVLEKILKLRNSKGVYGSIDIDIFVSSTGKIFVNEINPRFGGGYSHAYGCGVNFM
jgi:carbamoyl-phosphate synthase large subunit